MAEIKSQRYVQSIRNFSCPNCGNELELINKRSRYVGCNTCGTVMDARSEAHEVIMRLNSPDECKPLNFLRLGMEGEFNGEIYRILGRTRWKSTYLEYWKEGTYEGWGHEFWEYDEWVLMSKNQQYFYLIEDSTGFYISKSFLPKSPQFPTASNIKLNFNKGEPQSIVETGNSQVIFFEGESTYQIHVGDAVSFYEYKEAGKSYIVETRFDSSGNATEIEFFEESPISLTNIRKAFRNDPIVARVNNEVFGKYTFTKWVMGSAMVLSFLLWMYGMMYSGHVLFFGDLKFSPVMANVIKSDTTKQKINYAFDSVAVLFLNNHSQIDTAKIQNQYVDTLSGYTEPVLPAYDFVHIPIDKVYYGKSVYRESSYHLILPQSGKVEVKSNKLYKISTPNRIKHWFWIKDKKTMASETIIATDNTSFDANDGYYNTLYYRPDADMQLNLAIAPDMTTVEDTIRFNPNLINNVTLVESPWDTFPLFLLFVVMLFGFVLSRKLAELLFGNKTVDMIFEELESAKKGNKK